MAHILNMEQVVSRESIDIIIRLRMREAQCKAAINAVVKGLVRLSHMNFTDSVSIQINIPTITVGMNTSRE